jgi:hypothetical protein
LSQYPYRWREFISAFDELPLIGAWLEEQRLTYEQDNFMLAFTL